jgi:hypothetical protein
MREPGSISNGLTYLEHCQEFATIELLAIHIFGKLCTVAETG